MRLPVKRHEKKSSLPGQLFLPAATAGFPLKLAVKVVQRVRHTIPNSPNSSWKKKKKTRLKLSVYKRETNKIGHNEHNELNRQN